MKKEKITFSVQTGVKDIYRFNMYHVYSGFAGIFGVFLSLTSLALLVTSFSSLSDQSKTVLTFLAAWFIILYPLLLYSRAGSQVKRNQITQKPFDYQLDLDGITVSQGEQQQSVPWERVVKVVETRTHYFFYSSRVHAFIFPKKMIGESPEVFNESVCRYMEGCKVQMRGTIRRSRKK